MGNALDISMTGLSADLDMFLFNSCTGEIVAAVVEGGLNNCIAKSTNSNSSDERIYLPNASGTYYLVVDAPQTSLRAIIHLS
ncbi:MAG: hypothetical protein HC892_11750 [Saprospiraceae bacterium]|nr:hypothetical protein [Saprospiraceae bacterium]